MLGPPLWNLFYADARFAVHAKGFTEMVFADDVYCWREFVIPAGDNFKILAVIFDRTLLLHAAACEVATEAGWRL